ncbi:Scr1 family TA system antitoxin-like transcriptional regulator [Streptomyces sp. NPDC088725]|uniref:helix-turn-helix domain-containing protein n=1 Tax=Streptomyces sp. NPDC088725 TaxID=3365873 RepID=UPI00382A8C86
MSEPATKHFQPEEPRDGLAYFGSEVRFARQHKGATQLELAEATTYKTPYVSKVENGQQLGSELFAERCDLFFATSGYFARLRRRVSRRGYPDWFEPYVRLEQRASMILAYSSNLIMGILQTEAYAHAVFRRGHPRDELDVTAEKVARRLRRRQVLEGEKPPLLWVVLDESCLRRMVGSPAVMAAQTAHLIKEAESPHITIQVLPFGSGAPSSNTAFILLRFDEDEPDILYLENPISGQVIDSAGTVADMNVAYDRLRADALSPEASLDLMRKVMEEWNP